MSTPHKCPVCNDSGLVPYYFYDEYRTLYEPSTTAGNISQIACRACGGRGVLWEPAPQLDMADINQFEKALETSITWYPKPMTNSVTFVAPTVAVGLEEAHEYRKRHECRIVPFHFARDAINSETGWADA